MLTQTDNTYPCYLILLCPVVGSVWTVMPLCLILGHKQQNRLLKGATTSWPCGSSKCSYINKVPHGCHGNDMQ